MRTYKNLASQHWQKGVILSDQALVSGTNFFVGIIITRSLGLEIFGLFSLGWIMVLLGSSVQQAIVVQPMYVLLPKKKGNQFTISSNHYFMINLLIALFASSLILLLCYYSALVFSDDSLKKYATLISVTTLVFLLQDFFRRFLFVSNKPHKALIVDIIAYPTIFISLTLLHFFNFMSVENIWYTFILGFGSSSLISLLFFPIKRIKLKELKVDLIEVWQHSRWLIGATFVQWLSGNSFLLAAGSLMGAFTLGAIKMGLNLMGVLNVFFLALENKVPVSASRLFHTHGKQNMLNYLKRVTLIGSIFTIALIVLIISFADLIIDITYGHKYVEFAYVVIGFGLMQFLVFFGLPIRFAMRTLNFTKDIFYSYLLNASFSLIMAVPMVKAFGIKGVIAGLIISQIIMISWLSINLQIKWKKI